MDCRCFLRLADFPRITTFDAEPATAVFVSDAAVAVASAAAVAVAPVAVVAQSTLAM